MSMATKKSRPGTRNTRTAAEQVQASRQGHASTRDNTTAAVDRQTGIASLLMHGAKNAVPLRYLKQLTGLPGRDIRRQIEAARIAGEPILSDDHGYFLAENQQEITRFIGSMRRRAKRIEAVAAAVEGAAIE